MDNMNFNMDLLNRMIMYIEENTDRFHEIDTSEFWNDFKMNEDESYTLEELRDLHNILSMEDDNEDMDFFDDLVNKIVFLNWKHCLSYKKILEVDRLKHIVYSWIVSTPDEIANDVLLSLSEIVRRFNEMKDEYNITGIVPDCLKEDYLEKILTKIKERCNLEKELESEFENIIESSINKN